ncbi:hypothetical protein FHU40_000215 [Nocardioides soli]|uniref:Uncharacterized protein n=1 Tax=Nocardioides soli TaxID=1036020 RepID=A0A7W4YYS0_9ACTN|nr:hypothetical protein [Nocardioides soli]
MVPRLRVLRQVGASGFSAVAARIRVIHVPGHLSD